MFRRFTALFVLVILLACAAVACQVIGYDSTPGLGGSSWETVEAVDPVGGGKVVMVRTRAKSNTFFGKIMSVFGRPSFSYVCTSDKAKEWRIDWREAVGPPSVRRVVFVSVDGGSVSERRWDVGDNGRVTTTKSSRAVRAGSLNEASVLAVRVVNSGGENVTLLFNVAGYERATGTVDQACS